MKVEGMKVIEKEYNGYKFKQLIIIIDGKEFIMGTLKEGKEINYINAIMKKRIQL